MGLRGIKSHNLKKGPSDFDEIWPKVSEYGLSSFEAYLYVRKNLDLKIIHLIPLRTIGLRKLKVFSLGMNRN